MFVCVYVYVYLCSFCNLAKIMPFLGRRNKNYALFYQLPKFIHMAPADLHMVFIGRQITHKISLQTHEPKVEVKYLQTMKVKFHSITVGICSMTYWIVFTVGIVVEASFDNLIIPSRLIY